MKRMCINQPSTKQHGHRLHGHNVLADFSDTYDRITRKPIDVFRQITPDCDTVVRVYFTNIDSTYESEFVPRSWLQTGWFNK